MSDTFLVVGLGSNIKPHFHLKKALAEIKKIPDCRLLNVSRIFESDPELPEQLIDYTADAWNHQFLNSAVLLEVKNFLPMEFLKVLKAIESKLGRKPAKDTTQWAPREIDLDILYVDGVRFESVDLQIPHSRLLLRPFALLPLLEVFPNGKFADSIPKWADKSWTYSIPFNTRVSKKFFWTDFMGILNLTEDSFSDGQSNNNAEKFKNNALKLLKSGAQILDLGAESTRPLNVGEKRVVDPGKELSLLRSALEWLEEIRPQFPLLKISIDSRHSEVVQSLLKNFKIDFINDVTGFKTPAMRALAADSSCQVIVMHSLSVPVVKGETIDINQNPIDYLNLWWSKKLQELVAQGIAKERIIFDPGIGFGKTAEQSMHILKNLQFLDGQGCEVLIGHSRKSFLQLIIDKPAAERDPETALVTALLNKGYYNYLRVHDIESNKNALI